ncbi:MAG: hypothetical protein GY847_36455 [Proteobacteria bacterium]|nr:hypothetical protein [Pseudomonadota bacterium]
MPEGYISIEDEPCRITVPEKNQGLIRELLVVCRDTHDRVYKQLGLNRGGRTESVEVRVVSDPKDMGSVAPPGAEPPPWSGAVAYPDFKLVILSLRNRMGSPVNDLDIVLEHELSHLALREALRSAEVPRWFSEGVAIQQSEESSFRRYWLVWIAARGDNLLPLHAIDRYPDQAGQINLAYAQAADFVGFLLRKDGWLGIRIAIRECAKGAKFKEAFEFSYGDSLASFENEWRAGLMSRWQWLPLITGTGAVWGFIVILFLIAYTVAKRRNSKRLVEMEIEEKEEEERLKRFVYLDTEAPPSKPKTPGVPQVPTKIRVDDEIHTLH